MRLARIAQSVRTGNPFDSVLKEIKKMKQTIKEEGEADADQKSWCETERKNSNSDLTAKKAQIKSLNSAIDKLDETINDPKTGLKFQISEKETNLVDNRQAQKDQTATRKDENAAYRQDVSNLSDAEDILAKAIRVLKNYYDTLAQHMKDNTDSTNLMQTKEDPAPPSTYGDFEGQSGEGNKAVGMLEFILKETQKEHSTADKDENKAQSDFEASITSLRKAETDMLKSLVKLKAAIEAYLDKIKPGCDFIAANFDLRETNRATEKEAMENAIKLIKGTPAYQTAVAEAHVESLGDCDGTCKEHGESHVECK